MTATFAETLGTISVDEFLHETWGRTFRHLPGTPGRFHDVLPWSEVNSILQTQRLEPPRLRLVRKGEFAAKSDFLRYEGRGAKRAPHVVPEKLSERLRDGYTLIIDAVDDMAAGVMQLAEDFERVLHESVQVNMYAGWRELQGFHRHCDTHDVVVLQVFGRKYWRVYSGGRPHPLRDDIAANKDVPQTIAWEGTLEDGDVLYIPRGWWHEASGVGEVTLHLTFGIHPRNGVNLVHWLADQLRSSTEFRADLPRFGSSAERETAIAELRRQLLAAWDDDLLERYFRQQDAQARSRGWTGLPWTAEGNGVSLPASTRVTLATPRPLELVQSSDGVRFEANGKAWSFATTAAPLLTRLGAGPATLANLEAADGNTLGSSAVEAFVLELARLGLLKLTGERDA